MKTDKSIMSLRHLPDEIRHHRHNQDHEAYFGILIVVTILSLTIFYAITNMQKTDRAVMQYEQELNQRKAVEQLPMRIK